MTERHLYIPDAHIPFHDKKAWALVMRMAAKVKFDRIIILGDFADFLEVSFHPKDPGERPGFREEVRAVNQCLDQLDALKIGKKHFIAGNHEYRLDRYLTEKASALVGLSGTTVPELFRLKERGWSFTPYKDDLRVGKLWLTHDEGAAGPMAAVTARSTYEGNVVIGHCHSMTVAYKGNAKGETHVGASFGWLGDNSKVAYMHKVKSRRWTLGVGTGVMEKNGVVHLQAVPIIRGAMCVFGELYR